MRRFRYLCGFAAIMLSTAVLVLLVTEPVRPLLVFALVSAALLLATLPAVVRQG
jgi:hypothetical protein